MRTRATRILTRITALLLDNDFTRLYPKSSWASESVLRIGQVEGAVDDMLRVTNDTRRRLTYVLIEDGLTIESPRQLQHVACCAVDRPGFVRD